MAQLVAGTVGAVAGFFISGGNPMGALVGFNVGASLYASTQTTNVQGAKIGDISKQTSEEGVACPIVWGRVRPIGGNLIATSEPRIIKTTTTQSSGKGGGGKTKTTTEHVYRDYAIRICEGPVEVIRAWRNNELVYDARHIVLLGEDENDAFLEYGLFYSGSWDQMPDPTLESIYGVGNVPAHRGICYMVCRNELLDDTSGAVPSWLFEVERPEGQISTSKLYNLEVMESIDSYVDNARESPSAYIYESINSTLSVNSITLSKVINEYDYGIENINSSSIYNLSVSKSSILNQYDASNEGINSSVSVSSVVLSLTLINYSISTEGMSSSIGSVSVTKS